MKMQGNIVDILMAPLSSFEVAFGLAFGGVARGTVVAFILFAAFCLFFDMTVADPFYILFHLIAGCAFLSLLGLICGLWSNIFDDVAMFQNFIVMPATFFSGVFFTVEQLPEKWRWSMDYNPLFYIIDGFRYGFIGKADSDLATGLWFGAGVDLVLFALAVRLISSGWRLKP
jgi:ABC-2 type transport system permease protein